MIQIILIDDESKSLTSLEWELTNFCNDIEVVGKFTNPLEALTFLKTNTVDCIFLDIEMPQIDGFQFLDQINDKDFAVVFTTAYDQYAIKAIKERALDYLLKPIDSDELKLTLDRVLEFKKSNQLNKTLEDSLLRISKSNGGLPKKVSIPVDGKLLFLKPQEIIYCKSDGNYSTIFLENNEKLFLTKKLKEVEDLLSFDCFFRVHNSYLINLEKVKEFFKTDGYLVLSNNKKIPVSRNRKNSFLDRV